MKYRNALGQFVHVRTKYRNGDTINLSPLPCDGCSPCSVNGVFCHEAGCPDAWRDTEVNCFDCGFGFYPVIHGQRYCPSCIENTENPEPMEESDNG